MSKQILIPGSLPGSWVALYGTKHDDNNVLESIDVVNGKALVTTTGAEGPSKDFYYATGGSAATVDIPIPAGARIAVVTLEGAGIAKVCVNAPNNAVRDAWLAQGSSLTEVINHRRLAPGSDIDDRTFLVDLDSSITKLSFAPDATISAINVRSV